MRASVASVFLSSLALGFSLVEGANLRRRQDSAITVTYTVTEAAPTPTTYDWAAGATKNVPIHSSCNATQRALLLRGLDDAVKLASHAKDHVLRFGNSSESYTKYFGSAPTAEVIGWYDRIVSGDKGKIWFRCDDIDGNCQQDGKHYALSNPLLIKLHIDNLYFSLIGANLLTYQIATQAGQDTGGARTRHRRQ